MRFPLLATLTVSLLYGVQAQIQLPTGLPTLSASTDNAIPTALDTDTTSAAAATSTGTGKTTGTKKGTAAASSGTDSAAASSAASTTLGDLPALSTSTDSGDIPKLTDLPSLAGAFHYPPPTVPPTANAPYMQKSNLPEGTVFICVGAVLAFIGLVMVAWRIAVRWMVNRSVKKAAMTQYKRDTKHLLDADRKSQFYSQSPDSSLSMERLTKTGRPMSTAPPKQTPNASLFFSPTAGAGIHNMGSRNSSGYLPAGYYSVGNAAAGNGIPRTTIGGTGGTPRPRSESYAHTGRYEDSPQHSPELPPSRVGPSDSVSNLSTNLSTNISSTQGTRTPSNYLDDLMNIPPLPPPKSGSGRPHSEYSRR